MGIVIDKKNILFLGVGRGKSFFIDYTENGNGNDKNDGLTPATPLYSTKEAYKRITPYAEDTLIILPEVN